MKKNMSVVSLFLRSAFYKSMAVILISSAIQAFVFFLKLRSPVLSLEVLVKESFLQQIFMISGLLIVFILLVNFSDISSSYKSQLLMVKKRSVFLCQTGAGSMIFMIWFLSEILICILLGKIYAGTEEAQFITNQTLFLAFYRSPFLHFLLPFEDLTTYIRQVLIILSLGVSVSFFPNKKKTNISIMQIVTPLFIVFSSVRSLESQYFLDIPILLFFFLLNTARGFYGEEEDYGKAAQEN